MDDRADPDVDELLIFLHVPKTAGTSFVAAARAHFLPEACVLLYGMERTSAIITREIEAWTAQRRAAVRFIAGHQVWYGIHEMFPGRTPRYVTFLRDPVARVISDYYKILRTPTNLFHERMTRDKTSLDTFVRGDITPLVTNHMTVLLGRERVLEGHNCRQCEPDNEPLFRQALKNLQSFWFVGLTESYSTDLERVGRLVGRTLEEHHSNRPVDPAGKPEQIPTDAIAQCAQRNRMDIELYRRALLIHETQDPQPFRAYDAQLR